MENETLLLRGEPLARTLFLQLVDEHDAALLDSEAEALAARSGSRDWCLAAVPAGDWNSDLTPWPAAPVFGRQGFGDGAARTLDRLTGAVLPAIEREHPVPARRFVLCGYSLAGLFALWAGYQTDRFAGVVAGSPSVWYPGWLAYAEQHAMRAGKVYLSLGDREEKTRNPVMAAVGNAIREQERLLLAGGTDCRLAWNPGNHFMESDRRMAQGMAWMLEALR